MKKYAIVKGENIGDFFVPNSLFTKNKTFEKRKFELEVTLFDTRKEAKTYIEKTLPSQRIRELLNVDHATAYSTFELNCLENVYCFNIKNKQDEYVDEVLSFISEQGENPLLHEGYKILTNKKIHPDQTKQKEGFFGSRYYVL